MATSTRICYAVVGDFLVNVPFSTPKKLSNLLMVLGLLVLLYPMLTETYGSVTAYRMRSRWALEAARQESGARREATRQVRLLGKATFANEDAVLRSVVSAQKARHQKGFPETKIRVPKIGLEQVVVEGVGTADLIKGPGLYPGSPYPGETGNVLIAGHRVTYTKPFFSLDQLDNGDSIILETLDYIYEYKVAVKRVTDPKDVSMLEPADDSRLTLTTCNPKYSSTQRLDVQAVLASAKPRHPPTLLRRLIKRVLANAPEPPAPTSAYQLAVQEARAVLDVEPHNPVALTALGRAYEINGRYSLARKQYEAALSRNKNYATAHYRLARVLERQGERRGALDEYLAARKIDSNIADASLDAGRLLIEVGRLPEAKEIFQSELRRDPLSADNHYYLGLIEEKSGAYDLAKGHYREALRFVPDYKQALDGLKRIAKRLLPAPQPNTTTEQGAP